MPRNQNIKIGPAGWSDADWRGLVYPESAGSKFDTLALVAKYLDTAEINSSFYHPPSPTTATSWLKRIAHNPAFKFTAKLSKAFTHEYRKPTTDDEKMFREGIDPLREAGKLGAVLIQFPWSFKNDREERSYLTQLIERFKDQPLFDDSIKPSAEVTSAIGYVRLHGRNYGNWFREDADVMERYDYLYPLHELESWLPRIKEVAAKAKETFVITNNHARGQSLVNAFELLAEIEEQRVPAPAKLIESYPRLVESVEAFDEEQQGSLF